MRKNTIQVSGSQTFSNGFNYVLFAKRKAFKRINQNILYVRVNKSNPFTIVLSIWQIFCSSLRLIVSHWVKFYNDFEWLMPERCLTLTINFNTYVELLTNRNEFRQILTFVLFEFWKIWIFALHLIFKVKKICLKCLFLSLCIVSVIYNLYSLYSNRFTFKLFLNNNKAVKQYLTLTPLNCVSPV